MKKTLMRLSTTASAVVLLGYLASACQGNGHSPAGPTKTVTVTASPITDATGDASVVGDDQSYVDVIEFANGHGFPEIPPDMGETVGEMCEDLQNRKLDGAWGQTYRNAFVDSAAGEGLWTKKQTAKLFDVLVDGCVEAGHTTLWVAPTPLSHDEVVVYLRKHGYSDAQRYDENWNRSVAESCKAISKEKPGSYAMVEDRRAWWKSLRDTETRAEADAFVDTVFEGCYQTGHAHRWTPPPPKTAFGDGTWRVGVDVATGTYRIASADDYCLFYRLNKMTSATDPDAIISWGWANGGDPVLATIEPGDVAFQSMGCGTWHKIG